MWLESRPVSTVVPVCLAPAWHRIGVQRLTRGLGIVSNPTSDNLNPQKTTKEDAPEVGTDGPELSCPGTSVVAEEDEGRRGSYGNLVVKYDVEEGAVHAQCAIVINEA